MCLVKKENIPLLGTIADTVQRCDHPRVDDEARQKLIKSARKKIFGRERYVVKSIAGIEPLLKPQSYVPIEVSVYPLGIGSSCSSMPIECIFEA
jgi:hypothetical protein